MNKKFLSIAASTAIVASALVFTGCGSDSSTSSSSSTTSSGGSLTGTFVKGLWSGVPYTYGNGTQSGVTGNNGTFTYNTGDTVQFDLGLVKVNATAGSTVAITDAGIVLLDASNADALIPNGSANTTAVANMMAAMLVVAGNETTIESANGFNAATAIANLKLLKAKGLTVTEATLGGFLNKLDLNMTAANVSEAAGSKSRYAITDTDTTNLKNAIIATSAKTQAASTATTGSLNATRINNTVLVFSDNTYIAFGNSLNKTNVTGLTSAGAAVVAYADGNTFGSLFNANGSAIKLGATNMSAFNTSVDTLVLSSLEAGATAKFIVGANGSAVTKTLSKVVLDTKASGLANSTQSFTTAQYTLNLTQGTVDYSSTNLTMANGTSWLSEPLTNVTVSGTFNEVMTINSGNATTGHLNLTFDRDPSLAGNKGVLSNIVVTITSTITSLLGYVKSVLTAIGF